MVLFGVPLERSASTFKTISTHILSTSLTELSSGTETIIGGELLLLNKYFNYNVIINKMK